MKKLIMLIFIVMIGIKSLGNGEFIIWHPDNTVSLYVLVEKGKEKRLIKVKDLDIKENPIEEIKR